MQGWLWWALTSLRQNQVYRLREPSAADKQTIRDTDNGLGNGLLARDRSPQ
jgi:hypothetical protein